LMYKRFSMVSSEIFLPFALLPFLPFYFSTFLPFY